MARRKGDEWWVGTINRGVGREVSLSLSWLPAGKYAASLYSDAPDAGVNPNHLIRESRVVSAGNSVILKLAPGGGQVMRLRKVLNF